MVTVEHRDSASSQAETSSVLKGRGRRTRNANAVKSGDDAFGRTEEKSS
jgi:hypothetical protein